MADSRVKQLVLRFLLLLLSIEQFVKRLPIEFFSHGIPPESSDGDLVVQLLLSFVVTRVESRLSTVKTDLCVLVSFLLEGEVAQSAPHLSVDFKFDFLLLIRTPHIKSFHGFLDHFFLSVLDQLNLG